MEVEIREAGPQTQPDTTALLVNNTPVYPVEDEPELIVRAEEILLVALVLMLWVAAITMFFNRWGQIRTLEPYQPKFQQNHHRTSCPLAPLSPPHITPQQRMSFSKYNVNCFSDIHPGLASPVAMPPHRRPRLNSVFVAGSSAMAIINTPPRRVKSAIDIQHLILNEKQFKRQSFSGGLSLLPRQSFSGGLSLLPITSNYKERKPSIVIERPTNNSNKLPLYNTRRRPSMVMLDRPMLSHYYHQRNRKTSCFIDRRHKNFISFDQSERKHSVALDRTSLSSDYQQPSISFDTTPSVSFESPTVIIEHAEINHHHHHHHSIKSTHSPKFSRSLEQQPSNRIEKSTRISLSLDTHPTTTAGRGGCGNGCDSSINSSISSDDRMSPGGGNLDVQDTVSFDKESLASAEEIKDTTSITISFEDAAPLLERLKSSDV